MRLNVTTRPRVAIGSTNPTKIEAVRRAVSEVWPEATVNGIDVDPGVRAMPLGEQEAICGALNRARFALAALNADVGVGLEGYAIDIAHGTASGQTAGESISMFVSAWAAVVDAHGRVGLGAGGRFPLPDSVAVAVRRGHELGPLMDRLVDEQNTRQRRGAAGILSAGRVDRTEALRLAVVYALNRFVSPALYK